MGRGGEREPAGWGPPRLFLGPQGAGGSSGLGLFPPAPGKAAVTRQGRSWAGRPPFPAVWRKGSGGCWHAPCVAGEADYVGPGFLGTGFAAVSFCTSPSFPCCPPPRSSYAPLYDLFFVCVRFPREAHHLNVIMSPRCTGKGSGPGLSLAKQR